MNAIVEKLKADIAGRPVVSTLILITIIAAATLLTLALATLMNLDAPYDRSFQELNGAHLWLYFERNKIRSRDVQQVESLPGVLESTGLQYSVTSRVRVGNTRIWTSLRVMPVKMPKVNRLLIQEGRYLNARGAEILAGGDLNDVYGLSVGDTVEITRWDGKKLYLPVVGLVYNPTWDIYRNNQPPYLYLMEDTLRELFPDESSWDWSVGLRLADPGSVDQMLAHVEAILREGAVDGHTDWRDVKDAAIFEARLNFVFLSAFSFFAILATILVVASSISSTVLSQFKQIGILKAVGFTQNQILALYMGQYLVLSLIGSPLGLLIGIAISPLPLKSVAASLSTTFEPPLNLLLIALVLGTIPAVVIAATLGSAYRGAKANIIKAIAVGAEAPRKKPFWGVRLASRLGLPMVFVLGLNDVFARPFRSVLTSLNLTLGVIGIVFGLGLNKTLEIYRADPSLLGIAYDAVVTRSETSHSRTQHILRGAPGVEAFYAEYLVDAQTQAGQSFRVRAVEGNLAAFPFRLPEGRFFRPDTYEAMAGQGLLDWLGLEVGDEITLIVDDDDRHPITWRIVGEYLEPDNTGQMLMVNLSSITRAVRHPKPDTYRMKLASDANPTQLKHYLEPRADSDLNFTLVGQAIPGAIFYLQLAILALSSILIGIALVNVFNTSMLAMQEKLRVVGVLKTIGMTPAQVVAMVNTTAAVLGLVATGLGIPLGLAFTRGLLTALGKTRGFGQVNVNFSLLYALLLIPLMVIVSMAGSLIPARKAARVSIVSVLRNE
jgi:putative ABC transport system permease protein